MTPEEFLTVVKGLLVKIADARGSGKGDRSLYEPVRGTEFVRRKTRYFPDTFWQLPPRLMPHQDYVELRNALSTATDCLGELCLGADDLLALDEAWGRYSRSVCASEAIPKRFEALIRGTPAGDLSTPEGFHAFLYEVAYRPMLRGDAETVERNLGDVLAAFLNGHSVFATDPVERERQYAYLLLCGTRCMYRLNDLRHFGFIDLMRQFYERSQSDLLLSAILCQDHANDPSSVAAFQVLGMHMDGRDMSWGTTFGNAGTFVRAARRAITLGFDLDDKPDFLHGMSVRDVSQRGINELKSLNKLVEATMDSVTELYAHAAAGRVDTALTGAADLRAEAAALPEQSATIEAALLVAEARAYFEASGGNDRLLLHAAGCRIGELRKMEATTPLRLIGEDFEQFIDLLTIVSQNRLGSTRHMGQKRG